MRRMNGVVEDRLLRGPQFCIPSEAVPGIGVTVEAWEVGGGYLDANAVSFPEDVTGDSHLDFIFIDSVGFKQRRVAAVLAISCADNTIAQVHRIARGRDIGKLGGPVGIEAVCGGEEHDFDGAGDLQALFKWGAGIAKDIAAHFSGALVVWSPGDDVRRAAIVTAQRLHRVVRVVGEMVI